MLTAADVTALAPDPGAAQNARSIAVVRKWLRVGQDAVSAWGEFQGSALYQVRVDIEARVASCTCPSRKLPCKHGLALLYLLAEGVVGSAEAPEWIVTWREKRAARATPKPAAPISAEAADKRVESVSGAVDLLWAWLVDRARQGFADLDTTTLEAQAARLVDQKAAGLAARLRSLTERDEAGQLREAGRLVLLCEAFRKRDALDPALRGDLLATLGVAVPKDQVRTVGEALVGRWHHLGRRTLEEDTLTTTRDLYVHEGGRVARIVQYAPPGRAVPDAGWVGRAMHATFVYYPSPAPDRALCLEVGTTGEGTPPAIAGLDTMLDAHVDALAAVPWRDSTAHLVRGLRVHPDMWLVDEAGVALPLRTPDWALCAASLEGPLTLALEWDGDRVDVIARA